MRNLILSLFLILFFTACEKESETALPEGQNQVITPRAANKVNVCHNGNIINISINAIPDHQGHGDAVDLDGDGYFDLANDCGEGVDCDDTDPDINVDATDVPCNGLDEDCSGSDDESTADTWYEDADGDTYGNAGSELIACTQPEGYVADNTDCDDNNPARHPGATDIPCNGIDEDCSGTDDESTTETWYGDADGDTYGNAGSVLIACTQPEGYVADNTDCDDNNPGRHPGAAEICGNGIDDNCDGNVDEGCCPPGSNGQPHITNNGLYWTNANLNLNVAGSLCYDNNPANCTTNGRLYSEAAAQTACAQLGDCWRVPTLAEWTALVSSYGGYNNAGAFNALIQGGTSGFNALNTGGLYVPDFNEFLSFGLYGQYLSTSPGQRVCFQAGGTITQCSTGSQMYASCRCVKEVE